MTAEEAALVPVRVESVRFYDDVLPAVQLADGELYVALRPIVQALGLDWASQYQRVQRDEVLAESTRTVVVMTTDSAQRDRGARPTVCLPLKHLPGFLFGVSAGRVKPALHDKILRYRRECFDALWQAFKADVLPAAPPSGLTGAALAVENARAILHLAEQQLALEQEIATVRGKHEAMADYLRPFVLDTRQRLTALELQLSAGATISEAQAAEIALAVKNVGQRLTAGGDKAGYQKVYGELYRREGISSYKSLPAARYADVLAWLRQWYDEFSDAGGQ
jgi:hypothetical protein